MAWPNKFEKLKAYKKKRFKRSINACSVVSYKMVRLVYARRLEKKKKEPILHDKVGPC